jgi:hypothetical protein
MCAPFRNRDYVVKMPRLSVPRKDVVILPCLEQVVPCFSVVFNSHKGISLGSLRSSPKGHSHSQTVVVEALELLLTTLIYLTPCTEGQSLRVGLRGDANTRLTSTIVAFWPILSPVKLTIRLCFKAFGTFKHINPLQRLNTKKWAFLINKSYYSIKTIGFT